MNLNDVKDTKESREDIIKYIEYLEKGKERIPEEFIMGTVHKIFSDASVVAYKEVMERIHEKLRRELISKKKDEAEATKMFERARDKAFKHCIKLELKHNYFKKDSRVLTVPKFA